MPRLAAVSVAVLLTAFGCASGEPMTAASAPGTGGVPLGPYHTSVAELARTLTDKDLPCTLQYPGVRDEPEAAELSLCTVAGDQARLRVWSDRDAVGRFLATAEARTGTVVVGANWTVSLTQEATAQQVAAALGGIVPTGDPPVTDR